MKLTILGSGSLIFKKERMAPAYLVETNSGESFLFDCGATALQRFIDVDFDYTNLDHIVITHPHADHLGGLISLVFSIALKSIYVPYLGGTKREKPLFLHGYKGLTDDYQTLRKMMYAEPDEGFEIKVFEYKNKKVEFKKFIIKTSLVPHVEKYYKNKSIAVRLEIDNKSLVYSGDCKYNEQLINLSRKADVALFECSSPAQGLSGSTHLTSKGAGKIAQEAGVKRLVLTHHYDIKSPQKILKEARKYFSGKIIVAEDLMKIKI